MNVSLPHRIWRSNGHSFPITGKVLKLSSNKDGYRRVCIGGKVRLVHQLVAEAFIGPRPGRLVIRHKNGVPHDNRASNLTYGTQSDNIRDTDRHGKIRRGEAHSSSKVSREQLSEISLAYKTGRKNQRELAEEYGLSTSYVSKIVRGRVWGWLTQEGNRRV